MYLYYEHHRDATGKIVLTEMRLSSYGDGILAIRWKNPLDNMIFELCKTILKQPPIAFRSYDEQSKVWTYLRNWGSIVIDKIKEVTCPIGEIKCIEVKDLSAQDLNNRVDLTGKRAKMNADEFFYNHGTVQSTPVMTRDMLIEKLASLLETTPEFLKSVQNGELKKLYRRAALRLHPDRNNGDGKQMSELNSLWSVYNA